MSESSMIWTDGLGDGGPYSDDQWAAVWSSLFASESANAGVLKGVRSEYQAITNIASPCTIQPGCAVVNGTWHQSSSNLDVAIPTPAAATRIDRIVLRKTWATRKVRITRLAGVEGGGAPALVQSAGVTWDIPMWQASITTAGIITYTDERIFAVFSTEEQYPVECGGRLTLTTATPVTTADVLAAATLYYTPYKSDKVSVFVNSILRVREFTEISLSVAALSNATCYDIFIYQKVDGTLALEALAWASSGAGTSTRATALTRNRGVMVKNGDISRTYLGTIFMSAAGQTEDSAKRRYVWNYYNRVSRHLVAVIAANNWGTTHASWVSANADTTDGSGRFGLVIGLSEELVEVDVLTGIDVGLTTGANDTAASSGIGINSTSTDSSLVRTDVYGNLMNSWDMRSLAGAKYKGYPAVGYNWIQRIEINPLAEPALVFGDYSDVAAGNPKSGMIGRVLA